MTSVAGELFDYLYETGPMKSKSAAYMMHGVVSAIDYMHSRNVVHRDIKAENLLLVSRGDGWPEVKIIDFGFSTVLKMTSTNSFLGTAGYLAPEIRQHRSYSKSVDIWALGVLIYLTLSCQLPFESETYDLPPDRLDVEGRFVLTFSEPAFKGPYAEPVRGVAWLSCEVADARVTQLSARLIAHLLDRRLALGSRLSAAPVVPLPSSLAWVLTIPAHNHNHNPPILLGIFIGA